MQVTADLILRREATPQDAALFLAKVFDHTEQHLYAFQKVSQLVEGFVSQQGREQTCTPIYLAAPVRSSFSETLLGLVRWKAERVLRATHEHHLTSPEDLNVDMLDDVQEILGVSAISREAGSSYPVQHAKTRA